MRRGWMLLLCALLLLTLAACAAKQPSGEAPTQEPSAQAGAEDAPLWPARETLRSAAAEEITAIRFGVAEEGGAEEGESTDGETIARLRELLCAVTVGEGTSMGVTDADLWLDVSLGEEQIRFFFEDDILVLSDGGRYLTQGTDPLRAAVHELLEK